MSYQSETPFDSLESSRQFIQLLAETIEQVRAEVGVEITAAQGDGVIRRKKALQLVDYNLVKLDSHVKCAQRILNDLRTLRRLLLDERASESTQA